MTVPADSADTGSVLPSVAWARMTPGVRDQLLVCLQLPGQMQLCALGGHRLALRLGVLGPGRPAALLGTWTGVTTSLTEREHDPGQHYLILEGQAGYDIIFGYLADELHAAVSQAAGPEEVPRLMLNVLQLWSGFLARGRSELDRAAAVGLYAELAMLEQVVAPRVGWITAIALWKGPEQAPQDLAGHHLLVEVKSTSPDSQNATISSIDQLDPQDGRTVWLAQALREVNGGDSLLAIRDRIMSACAAVTGEWPVSVRMRMLQANLLHLQEDHTNMGVAGWRIHRTDAPGFPVLRRAVLPAALMRAVYTIDLAACAEEEGTMETLCLALDAERITAEVGRENEQ